MPGGPGLRAERSGPGEGDERRAEASQLSGQALFSCCLTEAGRGV